MSTLIFKQLVNYAKEFVKNHDAVNERNLHYFMINKLAANYYVTFEEDLRNLFNKEDIENYEKNYQHFPVKSEGIDIVLRIKQNNSEINEENDHLIPIELKVLKANKFLESYGFSVDETIGMFRDKLSGESGSECPEKKHLYKAYLAQFIDMNPFTDPPSMLYTNRKEGQIVWDFLRGIRLISNCEKITNFFQIILLEFPDNISEPYNEIKIKPKLGRILSIGKSSPIWYNKKPNRNYKWNITLNRNEENVADKNINDGNNFNIEIIPNKHNKNWVIIGIMQKKKCENVK